MSGERDWLVVLQALTEDDKRRLLLFARQLPSYPELESMGAIRKEFMGKISSDELAAMTFAIEIGCERIETNGW